MKTCNKCNELREFDKFGKDVRNSDGRTGICNPCKQTANKLLREKRIQTQDYKKVENKNCSQCGTNKPAAEFFKDQAMPDGFATVCKVCKKAKTYAWREANKDRYNGSQRAYQAAHPEMRYGVGIKRKYGCTLEQYNAMLVAQEGKCNICDKLHNPAVKRGRLFVDHDHKTGAIRGLLCGACNSALGYFLDDTRIMSEAIAYIIRHRKS